VRESFFSAHTPESIVARTLARLQEESPRALGPDMTFINAVKVKECDNSLARARCGSRPHLPHADVRTTARAYHTDAEFHPDMGHNMMLEPAWSAVAERIDIWLSTRGL
jgi:hypothetical protein